MSAKSIKRKSSLKLIEDFVGEDIQNFHYGGLCREVDIFKELIPLGSKDKNWKEVQKHLLMLLRFLYRELNKKEAFYETSLWFGDFMNRLLISSSFVDKEHMDSMSNNAYYMAGTFEKREYGCCREIIFFENLLSYVNASNYTEAIRVIYQFKESDVDSIEV